MEDLTGRTVALTSTVMSKFSSLLIQEQKLYDGVEKSEVEALRDDIDRLWIFLLHINSKHSEQDLSEQERNWLSQVKEVLKLIQDVLDEYVRKVSKRPDLRGFIGFLGKSGSLIGKLSGRRNLASNIENIKALLIQIKERGERYNKLSGIVAGSSTTIVERYGQRSVLSSSSEEYVVGIDSARKELVRRLTEGELRRSVIPVVGMAGVGKTTLVKRVYDEGLVRRHFDCCAWIAESSSYKTKELLKVMIRQICVSEKRIVGGLDGMRVMELVGILGEFLRPKRYILVFDDVCRDEFWRVMKHALPQNGNGSRVIVITRSASVAGLHKESSFDHVQQLEPLPEEMSLDLFRRITFRFESEQSCPLELEQLSHEIVRVCNGLPLAIITIAGLLSTKEKIASYWKKVLDDFSQEADSDISSDNTALSKTFSICFRSLSEQLKFCFLYFSLFPKDSLIPHEKLLKLWIAEDFIQEQKGKTLEEVAEECLNELINRNLVQACEGFYGLGKFCRVQGLMHEFARQMADKFNFCQFWETKNFYFRGKGCRLSICGNLSENTFEAIQDAQVHSVQFFNVFNMHYYLLNNLFLKFKHLTMLDFENVPLDRLPEELGDLIHLKYLCLKNTNLKKLPSFVGKLRNLQMLDLRNTLLFELPQEINMLTNLRHLLASGYDNKTSMESMQGVRVKEGIGCLKELQTLMTVEMETHCAQIGFVEELKKLTQMRKLGISRLTAEVTSALCDSIETMNNLEYLSLQYSLENYEIFDLQSISSPPSLLRHLVLKGLLTQLPHWIQCLPSLTMLSLSFSRLTDDPLKYLSGLPSLVSLWLYRAYEGEQLHFEEGGFQSLKLLVLRELNGLKAVEIDRNALPILEELRIGSSPLMNAVPSGLEYLGNLKIFANYDMPRDYVLSMQPDGGYDYWKVEHVFSVLFWYRVDGRSYTLYRLGESDLMDHLQGLVTNTSGVTHHDIQFCSFNDDEEDNDIGQLIFSGDELSFSSDHSIVRRSSIDRWSFSSGFYTDDLEE